VLGIGRHCSRQTGQTYDPRVGPLISCCFPLPKHQALRHFALNISREGRQMDSKTPAGHSKVHSHRVKECTNDNDYSVRPEHADKA
jgi:hypothetical protein